MEKKSEKEYIYVYVYKYLCLCITESFCCTPEINTILSVNFCFNKTNKQKNPKLSQQPQMVCSPVSNLHMRKPNSMERSKRQSQAHTKVPAARAPDSHPQ